MSSTDIVVVKSGLERLHKIHKGQDLKPAIKYGAHGSQGFDPFSLRKNRNKTIFKLADDSCVIAKDEKLK